jgi:peptide/nickel transport system substrate-binding protein
MKKHGIIAVLLFVVFGCSRPDQATAIPDSQSAPVPGDWAIIQFDGEPESLNWMTATTTYANRVAYGMNNSNVFETLMRYNPADWSYTEPLLAESYPEISEDHLTYTVTVRDGVKWHDGVPFSVDDVLFSIKTTMFPLIDSASKRGYFDGLIDVTIQGPRKIQFKFARPNFLNIVSIGENFPILPKHVYDPAGLLDKLTYKDMVGSVGRNDTNAKRFAEAFKNHPADRAPIGTGPYRFERWDTGKEIVLTRNEDYWGKKPYLEKVVYRIIMDRTAALTALKSGDVDFIPRLLPIQYAQQTSGEQFDSQFTKTTYATTQYGFIVWNAERPFFRDKRVRQALTMLIDRQQILDTIRFGMGVVTDSHFNPSSADYNKNLKTFPYDPVRAAQLLDEAGWKDTDGDGIRDKDGVPFRFEFLGPAGSVFTIQLMPVLRESFRKVGIDMTERIIEFTVMIENLRDHQFDASTLVWISTLIGDPYQVWHSSSAENRGSNYASFKNPEADRLIEQARTEFDPEKRRELYWRWQEIIHDEQPYTFLYVPKDAFAYHKRLHNVNVHPPDPQHDILEWFVPRASQKYTAAPPN